MNAFNAMNELSEQYLTFKLGSENFALAIAPIREIIETPKLTAIPLTPDFLRGVMNVRGTVVPVIDLALRFNRTRTEIGRRSCVIIVEVESEESGFLRIGMLVDAVNEVLEVNRNDIGPRPDFGLGIRANFVQAMIKQANGFVVVLEPNNVLAEAELAAIADANLEQFAA